MNMISFIKERDHWSAILGATATQASRQANLDSLIASIPLSRKTYTITIKENRSKIIKYLGFEENYYQEIIKKIMKDNINVRECIWIEEKDSRQVRHIHGIIASRREIKYQKIKKENIGLHIFMKKCYRKVEKKSHRSLIYITVIKYLKKLNA